MHETGAHIGRARDGSWLTPTAADRERTLDMDRRIAPVRMITLGLLTLTALAQGHWFGWWTVLPLLGAAVIFAVGARLTDRVEHPEYVLFAAWVGSEVVIAMTAVVTEALPYILPWLAIPVITLSARFSLNGVLAGIGVALGLMLAAAFIVDPQGVLDYPPLVISPAAVIISVGILSTALMASEIEHRDEAVIDQLTGMLNRKALQNRVAELEQQSAISGHPIGLIVSDLDHFKSINDTLGHAAGDAVLAEIGRRLHSCLRQDDLAARLGGDEFALVIRDVQSDEELTALARRLVQVLAQPFDVAGRQVPLGSSIGIAIAPEHGRSLDELMGNADLALYAAKEAGRGRFEFFVPRLADRHRRRVAIEQALRGALARCEMHLHWQPRVDIERWEVVGAEVLLRWQHPELGRVAPDEFIRIAEDAGLIADIGLWVLGRACAHAAQMKHPIVVSVNVSPAQLLREDFAQQALRVIQRSGLAPERLEIEVTESLFMDNSPQALANLHALRDVGVRIALDDFGTGYSSLAYLRRFPFDTLKIDRAFVRELMTRHDARAIVKTILELARTLGMSTIAEGVEEPAQLEVLREAGCGSVQGYLAARPMPRGDFLRLLANWTPAGTVQMDLDAERDAA
jgi:diguanylate cyclase (GGDEF)-like protein